MALKVTVGALGVSLRADTKSEIMYYLRERGVKVSADEITKEGLTGQFKFFKMGRVPEKGKKGGK